MLNKPLVFICIPTLGKIDPGLVERLIEWTRHDKYDVQVYFPRGMLPLDNARNHCVSEFIQMSNSEDDRLWFIDDDIVPPFNALDILMTHDKDIVGLLCFMVKENDLGIPGPIPIAVRYDENKQYKVYFDGKGLTEVDALGGGCIMIKRKVYETIGNRPYEFHYYPDGSLKLVGDYSFCQKAQEKNFKIYVDFGNLCDHMKEVSLLNINNLLLYCKNN